MVFYSVPNKQKKNKIMRKKWLRKFKNADKMVKGIISMRFTLTYDRIDGRLVVRLEQLKINGSQLNNPDISGAIFTLSLSILILNSQCLEGARDVRVL